MPRTRRKLQEWPVSFHMPASMADRLERVAPAEEGRRSAFIREAVEAALQRAEREQADGSAA